MLLTRCFVPRRGFLYTVIMIVPGRGFLLPSSRVPGGMVLDEIDTCIMCPGEAIFKSLRFKRL